MVGSILEAHFAKIAEEKFDLTAERIVQELAAAMANTRGAISRTNIHRVVARM
jgi:hypothetical protein